MDKKDSKKDISREKIRKMDEKIDTLRYERRQIENIKDEDDYIYRHQENIYEDMYKSTNDTKMRALIEEINMSKKKRRSESDDTFIEMMKNLDKQERKIEDEREELRQENEREDLEQQNKDKNSRKTTKENEKENRWF